MSGKSLNSLLFNSINICLDDSLIFCLDIVKKDNLIFDDINKLENIEKLSIDEKITLLYKLNFPNYFIKKNNFKDVYDKIFDEINYLIKFIVICDIENNKNNLNYFKTNNNLLTLSKNVIKSNLKNDILLILFNFYYGFDCFINSISYLAKIINKNKPYSLKNINTIDIFKNVVNEYFIKEKDNLLNLSNKNIDLEYVYIVATDMLFDKYITITNEFIMSVVMTNLNLKEYFIRMLNINIELR